MVDKWIGKYDIGEAAELVAQGVGGGSSVAGKALAGTTLGNAVQKGAGRVAYNFVSEGAEEVLSDLTDPLTKYITGVDKNVGENYNEVMSGLGKTFMVGGTVGTVMGGAQDNIIARTKAQLARGGARAVRSDRYLQNAMEVSENLGADGKDAESDTKYAQSILQSYQNVSDELVQMTESERKRYLESIGVHKLAFDKDGKVVAAAMENVNPEAVSPALRAVSANLSHSPISAETETSESARVAKDTVQKAIGKGANVVISEDIGKNNALYNPDEDVIYISNGTFDGGTFNTEDISRAIALHEVTHKAEGTRAFGRMAYELEQILEDENAPGEIKALVGDYAARREEIAELYADEDQSDADNEYVVNTELVANMVGDLLGNPYFVERMGARNDGAWKRFVTALKLAHDGKAGGISKEAQKYLSGLYKAYVRAVDDAGQGFKISSMVDEEEKEKAPEGTSGQTEKEVGRKNYNERYSLSKNAKTELHKALYDTGYRSEVRLRDETPAIMLSQKGVRNLPMAMNASHIRENVFTEAEAQRLGLKVDDNTHYHGLGENFFLKIVDGLDDVTEAYRGTKYAKNPSRRENYFLLVSKFKDVDGNVINVPVYINEFANYNNVMIDVNKISTVYGKEAFYDYIQRQIRKKNLVKIKNRSTQTGERPALIAGGYGMDASSNSIPQNSEKSTENAKKVSDERSSKQKVYPKKDASTVIDEVVSERLIFDDVYGEMKGKTKKDATNILWKALNTAEPGKRGVAALRVADYVIDNAVAKTFGEDPNVEIHAKTLSVLKPYLRKLDLDGIKGEIANRFGKKNSIHLVWGRREGDVGVAPDAIKAELNEQGVNITANHPADIFFEIYDLYNEAKEGLERSTRSLLKNGLTSEERETLRQEIARDILKAYDEKGVETLNFNEFYRALEKAERHAQVWEERYHEEIARNQISNRLLDKARQLDDLKKGAFLNATQSKTGIEKFKGSVFRLARIRFRGNLNRTGTRKIFAALSEWYEDKENLIIKGTPGVYNESVATALKTVAQNQKPLSEAENAVVDGLIERFKTSDIEKLYKLYTVENLGKSYDEGVKVMLRELSSEVVFTSEELKTIEAVVDYFTHFVKNYNKVWRAGKYVDAIELAKGYVARLQKRNGKEPGMLRRWFEAYYESFGDPMALARYMDRYDEKGFFTETIAELRHAALEAAVLEMNIREPIENFYKKHKEFLGDLRNKNVKVWNGEEIPLAKGIALYMTLGREQAVLGLARSGFTVQLSDKSKAFRLDGFAPMEEIPDSDLPLAAKEARDKLYAQFTDAEKTYIGLVEAALEKCKEAKHSTDLVRMGFSNTIDGYYFPISRAYISHSIESKSYEEELASVINAPFNKDTVTGAKGELFINDVDAILDKHVRGITKYAKLSAAIDNFNVIYALDVGGNANKVTSVMSESKDSWRGNEDYFKKMIDDIKGIPSSKKDTIIDELLPMIRGGYAKFQLGANPKTWLTQLSSLAAASSILDVDCIVKGLGVSAKDVDEFCALAKLRNSENAVAMAQGLIEKTSAFGDLLMKPIGMMDRFVIGRLYAACQVQASKNGGPAVGTKENKVKAGELLEKVIFETQQNSLATEKSAGMRSGNEFTKALTMFSADGMKVFGRVVDGVGECLTIKSLMKDATDAAEKERLGGLLRVTSKKARRAIGSLMSSALLMALLALGINKFLGREEEEPVETFVGNAVGNLVGGLPVIRDIMTFVLDGYEINNYAYSAMNDMLESAAGLWELGGSALDGSWDARETAKAVRKLLYASGTVLGVPTRNIYNYTYGLINQISEETGYKMDDLFYKQSYREDLAKAVENGDEGMIATISALMLDESIGGLDDKALRQVMSELTVAGLDVLPQSVKDSVTYDGQKHELTSKQKKAFEKTYFAAHDVAAKLVKSQGFAAASDEVKARAITFVYDLYYDMAVCERVGAEADKNSLFVKAIDADVLALAVATARSLESDKDENGNAISGSLRKKIRDYVESLPLKAAQKYMIMGYLGYKNAEGEAGVRDYIQSLKMTAAHKQALFNASGY